MKRNQQWEKRKQDSEKYWTKWRNNAENQSKTRPNPPETIAEKTEQNHTRITPTKEIQLFPIFKKSRSPTKFCKNKPNKENPSTENPPNNLETRKPSQITPKKQPLKIRKMKRSASHPLTKPRPSNRKKTRKTQFSPNLNQLRSNQPNHPPIWLWKLQKTNRPKTKKISQKIRKKLK